LGKNRTDHQLVPKLLHADEFNKTRKKSLNNYVLGYDPVSEIPKNKNFKKLNEKDTKAVQRIKRKIDDI
jgi:hypothetical protein